MSSIRHKPLNLSKHEIRLLELSPASNVEDRITCRLVTVSLDDDPEYIGVSALYGDPSQGTETITINGFPTVITSHVAQAIRNVRAVFCPSVRPKPTSREHKAPRWLQHLFRHAGFMVPESGNDHAAPLRIWLEMLCVNPRDDRERSRLCRGQIYASAKMVVGWMGLKIKTTDAGLAAMKAIDDAMPSNWGEPEDMQNHPENYPPQCAWAKAVQHLWEETPDGTAVVDREYWVGAADFMHRPYLERSWLLQEMSSARLPAFLIGDSIVPWNQLLRLNKLLEGQKQAASSTFVPPEVRSQLYEDLPLGTVHALLDEFDRRIKLADLSVPYVSIDSIHP